MANPSALPAGAPPTPSGLHAWRQTAVAWARSDGANWVYIFKTVVAALLAMGIAMRLDLPQPRTAMTTVFIVMQPQSALVLAKSFYRIAGTLIGSVVTLAIIALFAQQRELFLLAVALWIGVCTAGAARNRNFRSYGFVLAGYTAALIGIPAAAHPDGALAAAVTRVTEVSLGVLCAAFVSAVVGPERSGEQMRLAVRERFAGFIAFVTETLAGRVDRRMLEETNARFVTDIVGMEAMRSVALFNAPEIRVRRGRLARLNSEFMAASTRLHALHQLLNRLLANGSDAVLASLQAYFHEIAPLLTDPNPAALDAAGAARATERLSAYQFGLPKRLRDTRAILSSQLQTDADLLAATPETPGNPALLDFDTAAELLTRLVGELRDYTATYASLADHSHARERWYQHYVPKTDPVTAIVAGARAALVMLLLSAFWIASAWPSGSTMVLIAAAICAIVASAPRPAQLSLQMACGTIAATLASFVVNLFIFPNLDGFPLLCAALTPFLMAGMLAVSHPKWSGYGMGFCIFFCFLAGPDNVIQYDPAGLLNNGIALIVSMFVTAAACAVVLPPSSPWLLQRLLRNLRRQVVLACDARLAGLAPRFESGTRDLLHQANAALDTHDPLRRTLLSWTFSVLEIGHAIISLRQELADLPPDPRYARSMPWRRTLLALRHALVRLFEHPTPARLERALSATATAIAALQLTLRVFEPPAQQRRQLEHVLGYLHFIRTALLDPQSPLAAAPASGVSDAA